jgi:hypothetical protein
MNSIKAWSLQSLVESKHGANDSLLAESLQLDIEEVFRIFFIGIFLIIFYIFPDG